MKKIYKSKIGLEIVLPILIILGFGFKDLIIKPNLIAILLLLLILSFISYILFSNKYIIDKKNLIIKGGFINLNIDIEKISKVEKTFNILASPASSLDRLEVKYNDGNTILISPKNKNEFVNDLKKINPNIIINIGK